MLGHYQLRMFNRIGPLSTFRMPGDGGWPRTLFFESRALVDQSATCKRHGWRFAE